MNHLLTIVIPTFERRDRLKRSIRYWLQSGYEILVADGSAASNSDLVPKSAQYFHDPDSRIEDRWINAIRQVRTEYILLCADDDFIGFDAIRACVLFLQKHLAFSSAQGLYASFFVDKVGVKIGDCYGRFNYYPLEEDDLGIRLVHCLRYYAQTIYSVQRKSDVLKYVDGFGSFGNDNLFEIMFTLGNALTGKHKVFPFLYGVRESIIGSAGSVTPSVSTWRNCNPDLFLAWKEFCVQKFIEIGNLQPLKASELFDRSYSAYEEFLKDPYCLAFKKPRGFYGFFRSIFVKFLKTFVSEKFILKMKGEPNFAQDGASEDLVQFVRRKYGAGSVQDAARIQRAIFGS
jgi:glycosyltransferase domain-containing protein